MRLLNPFTPNDGYLGGQPIALNRDGDLVVAQAPGEAVWLTADTGIQPATLDNFLVDRYADGQNPYGLKFLDERWFADSSDIPNVHPHFFNSFIR